MRPHRVRHWLALVVLAGACSGPSERAKPGTHLEHAFFFTERDHRGGVHPVSAKTVPATVPAPAPEPVPAPPGAPAGGAAPPAPGAPSPATGASGAPRVERVADGATIDVNSKLVVQLRHEWLGRGKQVLGGEDLEARARDLVTALDSIGEYYEIVREAELAFARREAIPPRARAGTLEEDRWGQLQERRADFELRLLGSVRALWPARDPTTSAERIEVESIFAELDAAGTRSRAVERLTARVQQRVQAWQDEVKALAAAVDREFAGRKLRIEAFVRPRDGVGDPTAVHVPGYDTLDQGNVSVIDRFGVFLTDPERERLARLSAATHDVAAALERLRAGDASWQQALLDVSQVVPIVANLAKLAKELEPAALQSRIARTRTKWDAFRAEVRQAGDEFAANGDAWQAQLDALLGEYDRLGRVVATIRELETLVERWQRPTSADLPALIADSLRLARVLVEFAGEARDAELVARLRTEIGAAIRQLKERLAAAGDKVDAAFQPVVADLEQWRLLVEDVLQGVRSTGVLLTGKQRPPRLDVVNVAAIDVPLEGAADTEIDVRTTPRRPGDLLELRIRLLSGTSGKDVVPALTATLGIEKLGWHAELIPAVAYVTADRLAGASDRGGFSPAVSWMWSYEPRDDEADTWLGRTLDWGAGLHACFLNFDPEREVQIGLGLTVSLWDNRLIGGAGYNLFAESENDGRFYFFFGSSLIPLLQALNNGS